MRTIIVGGGKIGFYLAKTLLEHGNSVVLVELDKEQCRFCANELNNSGVEVVCGDGTDDDVLRTCRIQDTDAIVAVMGQDENNLVCCQIAKRLFGVKKTIAKVNNPRNAETLKLLGEDIVISATEDIIQLLEHEVDISAIKKLIPLSGGASLLEITLPEDYKLDGETLMDIPLPQNCNIVCIDRNGHTIIPRGKTTLHSGDILLAVALGEDEKELRKALKIKQ